MTIKRVIINSVHTLEYDTEGAEDTNDVALISEIGLIPYLESCSAFIISVKFNVGSMIVEDTEQKVELNIDV